MRCVSIRMLQIRTVRDNSKQSCAVELFSVAQLGEPRHVTVNYFWGALL